MSRLSSLSFAKAGFATSSEVPSSRNAWEQNDRTHSEVFGVFLWCLHSHLLMVFSTSKRHVSTFSAQVSSGGWVVMGWWWGGDGVWEGEGPGGLRDLGLGWCKGQTCVECGQIGRKPNNYPYTDSSTTRMSGQCFRSHHLRWQRERSLSKFNQSVPIPRTKLGGEEGGPATPSGNTLLPSGWYRSAGTECL